MAKVQIADLALPPGPQGPQGKPGSQGLQGLPGVNAVPADSAVAQYLVNPETATGSALDTAAAALVSSPGTALEAALTAAVAAKSSGGSRLYPTMRVNTVGLAPVVSKEVYLNATYTISEPGNPVVETGTLRIRGRGNYTWGLPKKPYRLNFDVANSPLETSATQRNWALLANHDDPRKTGYSLALWLAAQFENYLEFVPECRPVELILNNVYQGFYLLADLWRVEAGRVPGSEASGLTGDAMTGTWLAEISRRYILEGDPGFNTTRGVMVQYDTPEVALDSVDAEELALAQYFRDHIQAFENALYSNEFTDPVLGYAKYVDMQSFAAWYLISEFTSSQDSNFESSIKLWKKPDAGGTIGKLFLGVWDLSISFGLVINQGHDPDQWYTINQPAGAHWIRRMNADPAFRAVLAQVWGEIKELAPELMLRVDQQVTNQDQAVLRDGKKWTDLPAYYATEVTEFTKSWIQRRVAFIDANLASLPQDASVPTDVTPPTVPGSVTNTAQTDTTLTFTWTASTDAVGVTGYRYRLDGGTPVEIGNVLLRTVTGLTQETEYDFQVSARDAAGNWSAWSVAVPASTVTSNPGIAPVTAYDSSVMADAPIAYFPLRETALPFYNYMNAAQTAAIDGAAPTVGAGVELDAGGIRSARWDGAASKGLKIPVPAGLVGSTSWSMEVLVKVDPGMTAASTYKGIIGGMAGFRWNYEGDWSISGAGGVAALTMPLIHNDGLVHLLSVVRTPTNLKMYVDGILYNDQAQATYTIPAGDVTIGTVLSTHSFMGDMAGVAFFNTALSGARVLAHATAAGTYKTPPALNAHGSLAIADGAKVYLPLDDYNVTVREASGSGAVASPGNAGRWPLLRKQGLGIYQRSGGWQVPPQSAGTVFVTKPADFNGDSAITIEAIIQTAADGSGHIVSRGNDWRFQVAGGTRLLSFSKVTGGVVGVSSAAALPVDTAVHVAAVYNGTDARLYINGVLSGTVAMTGPIDSLPEGFAIGQQSVTDANLRFKGLMNGVAIYPAALSAAQIAAHADAAGF